MEVISTETAQTAAQRYEVLSQERDPFLKRARRMSEFTIPGLFPREGSNGTTEFVQPYQSVGADGVNNLSSKIMLALFPAGQSFFRLTMDDFVVEELRQNSGSDEQFQKDRAVFEEALGRIERAVMNRMEQKAYRTVIFTSLQHLIVTGNGLVHVQKDTAPKFFPLDKYVVKRDLSGNVLEIVIKESLARLALPPEARSIVERVGQEDGDTNEKSVDLYTYVKRQENGLYKSHQEISGEIIPDSEGTYPKLKSAFIPLRWRAVPGEDYGRGHCEEYAGDLASLEALSQAIVEFAGAAAKVLFMVRPGGVTRKDHVARAPSGAVVDGDAKDVTVLQMEKFADFQVAFNTAEKIRQRLEKAFLLASAVQRDAERVTAEEIRVMAQELEQGVGGVYTLLAEEYQRPLVVRLMLQMQAAGELPHLPEGTVAPQIVTGLEGLGRASEFQRLQMLVSGIGQEFGPDALKEYVNVGGYLKRKAAALSVDTGGVIRDEKEVQAARQAAAQQQATEKLGPSVIGAVSKGAEMQMQNQQQNPQPTQGATE